MNLKHILLCERASLERLGTVGSQPHEVLEKANKPMELILSLPWRKSPWSSTQLLFGFLSCFMLSYIVWQRMNHPKDSD